MAIAVKDGRAVGYVCDGKKIEAWLEGTLSGSDLALKSKDGTSTITATADDKQSFGTVAVSGKEWPFAAKAASSPAGLYEGRAQVRGVLNRIGWILLQDGSQTGVWNRGRRQGGGAGPRPGAPRRRRGRRRAGHRPHDRRRRRGDRAVNAPTPAGQLGPHHHAVPRLRVRHARVRRARGVRPPARRHVLRVQPRGLLLGHGGQGLAGDARVRARAGPARLGADHVRADPGAGAALDRHAAPLVGAGRGAASRCPWPCTASTRSASRPTTLRGLVHSVAGCFFYGVFVAKMLVLQRHEAPGWALPVLGGAVFTGADRALADRRRLVLRHLRPAVLTSPGEITA